LRTVEEGVIKVFVLVVASWAACGEVGVAPGLVGCQIAFLGAELVKATAYKFVESHEEMGCGGQLKAVVIWGWVCCVPMFQ
jgi:hypothetical protein